jgi:hypothetical protein
MLSSMPTVRQLQARLAGRAAPANPGAKMPEGLQELRALLQLSPETSRAEGERRAAPLVTRDAVLALLAEQRKASRWARWACWGALASVGLGVAVLLLR